MKTADTEYNCPQTSSSILFKIFFYVDHFLKPLLNLLQYCFCFMFWFFWPRGMWDFSSQTRDWTCIPWIGRRSLNLWTTREVPKHGFWEEMADCPGLGQCPPLKGDGASWLAGPPDCIQWGKLCSPKEKWDVVTGEREITLLPENSVSQPNWLTQHFLLWPILSNAALYSWNEIHE